MENKEVNTKEKEFNPFKTKLVIEVKKLEDTWIKFCLESNIENIKFSLGIKEFNMLFKEMNEVNKLNKLSVNTIAYTDSGKTFDKTLNIHTDGKGKPLLSAGGWSASYLDNFLKNYPLQQDWVIDIMGRNHGLSGESVCVKKEDINEIIRKYKEIILKEIETIPKDINENIKEKDVCKYE